MGHYHDPAFCDGSGLSDSSCVACSVDGACPYGFYYDASLCDGAGTVDSCVACSSYGSCAAGKYFDAGACDGSTNWDANCKDCSGTCPEGQWKDFPRCFAVATMSNGTIVKNNDGSNFTTATEDWCTACPTSCPTGYFVDEARCTNTTGAWAGPDVFCTACSLSCSPGEFLSPSHCLGYSNSDDICQPCITAGFCPDGFFYDTTLAECDGTGTDSLGSCAACTALGDCPAG